MKESSVKERLAKLEQNYINALRSFGDYLKKPEMRLAVKTDDTIFSHVVHLAMKIYGIQQARISEEIGVSTAQVGRWGKGRHLPTKHTRPSVLDAISNLVTSRAHGLESSSRLQK